jgi:hypothetical protein
MRRVFAAITALALAAPVACVGSTGSDLVTFQAYASGLHTIVPGQPFAFDSGRGFHVVLTKAKLHVGALYLQRGRPISGAQPVGCINAGVHSAPVYVAEVVNGLDVDVLSPTPQPFPIDGDGSADRALTAEVWFAGAAIDAPDDPTVVLDVAGTATKGANSWPFEASFTIGQNRAIPPFDSTLPGSNPICKQRIATPIAIDLTPTNGGALYLEVDARAWFANVDFTQLPQVQASPPLYRFTDSSAPSTDQPSRNLFQALHAFDGVYAFSFR